MRLLYLADPFLPVPPPHYGGIERIIASVIRGAQAGGHEVALLAHPDSELPGVLLHPLQGGAAPTVADNLRNASRVRRTVLKFQPDLIHSFARLAYISAVSFSPIPKIMAFHREPTAWTVRWSTHIANGSLTFTGCSDFITKRGRAHGGRWESIPNGIDLESYTFQPSVSPNAPLVFLSRIERVKGPHHAIAAARAAGRRLIIAGNHAEAGPEAQYWRNEIVPQIGRDGISYCGAVDDRQKSALLGEAAALLVPVEWEEPFGMVFAEALACGTPVISFRRGALPEIVENGRHGFLCGHPEELPAAIEKISSIDRGLCRRRAEHSLSSALMARRHENLYQRLAERNPNVTNHVHVHSAG